MTQAEVETLLPLITPFTVPALMDVLYDDAYDQFIIDAPACAGTSQENRAITYYIASMLSSGAGAIGVKSEKIDDYTIAYGDGGAPAYYEAKYQKIVDNCNYHALVSGITDGVTRADTLDDLNLDNSGIVSETTEEEFV